MVLNFRCKACNHPLTDEEVMFLDDTDWLCSKCDRLANESFNELVRSKNHE